MPTEIALVDGTKLLVADDNERVDDVLRRLSGAGHPDWKPEGGYISIDTTGGEYRIHPAHVVYVRWIDAAAAASWRPA